MKTISIKEVANGWLVQEYPGSTPQGNLVNYPTHVFRDIKELQEKLPELLGLNDGMARTEPRGCPTCCGSGKVQSSALGSSTTLVPCPQCLGLGVLTISNALASGFNTHQDHIEESERYQQVAMQIAREKL